MIFYLNINKMFRKITKDVNGEILYFCPMCDRFLSKECFGKSSRGKVGIQTYCKECRREYNVRNKDKNRAKNHSYYINNKEEIISKTSEYRRDKVKDNGFARERFHQDVRGYCKDAGLVFNKCYACGKDVDIVLHHPSYGTRDMRSVVVPLCRSCHLRVHSGDIECPAPINVLEIAPGYCKSRRARRKSDELK